MILFALDETTVAVAQQSLLDENVSWINLTQTSLHPSNGKSEPDHTHIVVTWIKANETETDNSPFNSINNQEFWPTYDQHTI
jgi:hypothetical protein